MSKLTNYAETALTNHILGKAAYTMPTTVYLALFTADPTDSGTLTAEVPASRGYARQAITSTMSTSSGGSTSQNSADINFGPCVTTSWGTVTHIGIVDSATIGAGNLLFYGPVTASKAVAVGDSLRFAANNLTVSID